MLDNLQSFVQALPGWLQRLVIATIAAIPFVEAYTGTLVGVIIGVPPVLAASAAIAGNAITMIVIVIITDRIRQRAHRGTIPRETNPRHERSKRLFERFGVLGMAFLVHPSQIASAAMVGRSRRS